jgi:hypothetical protein
MKSATLLLRRTGRDSETAEAFIDAAVGHAHAFTFIETENGKSICDLYLGSAWVRDQINDSGKASYLFTLKNRFGVGPTRFPSASAYSAHTWHRGSREREGQVWLNGGNGGMDIAPSEHEATGV